MNRLTGILLIVISAASFGSLAIFGRFAYAAGIDVFTLLFLRFSLSAVLMGGVLILRHELTFLTPPEDVETMLKLADKMLYQVKNAGKNAIEYAEHTT
jgi:hypothetical protein